MKVYLNNCLKKLLLALKRNECYDLICRTCFDPGYVVHCIDIDYVRIA